MILRDVINILNGPSEMVSVYESTPDNPYRTLYEGVGWECPINLMERDVCCMYAVDEYEGLLCIGLDGYEGMED